MMRNKKMLMIRNLHVGDRALVSLAEKLTSSIMMNMPSPEGYICRWKLMIKKM
jgi:hypothetical protein